MRLLASSLAIFASAAIAADSKPVSSSAAVALTAPLAVGSAAPSLTAKDHDGKSFELSSVFSKGPTLVYFYPKADTPGCTKQGCSLRDNWAALQEKGIHVLGVSGDKPDAQKAFREKFTFPFPLIADDDGSVAKAFGVQEMRPHIYKRTSFLVKDGKIAWTMADKTTTETHASDVLKAMEALK